MTALTKKRLEAIREGLTNSLAGALEQDREPYEKALEWANEQLAKRRKVEAKGGASR